VPKPAPHGAEATLGATASPLGQPFGNRGQALKARSRPKKSTKILEQQTGLNPCIVLIFSAGIGAVTALDAVVENLADLHARIDANGLNAKHF